jgi:ribosomal protein L7/L12
MGVETLDWAILAIACSILFWLLATRSSASADLRRIERKLNALLRHQGIDPAQTPAVSERIKQLAADPARKIEAIKAYREETGASLVEAKEAVEAIINGQ